MKLGEILIKANMISRVKLNQALMEMKKANLKLGQYLVREGILLSYKYRSWQALTDSEFAEFFFLFANIKGLLQAELFSITQFHFYNFSAMNASKC